MYFPTMDYFRAIHNSTGLSYAKDAKVAEYRTQFAADFDSSINVVHGALRNDIPQDFIIVPTQEGCDLQARPGETFNIGDIIYYGTLHWLVTDINFHDDLTRSGKMVRCNRQIRWQNRSSGEIIERWCLATKPYTSNIAEGLAVANSNREFKIQLTYDEETILVDLDRRFLLEVINGVPKAYQVTSVDTLTNRYQDIDGGFLVWNLKQCEYNPATDNAELMIADYYDLPEVPDVDTSLMPCFIVGRNTIRQGTTRTYKAGFAWADGTPSTSIACIWHVKTDSNGIKWEIDGDTLTLSADDMVPEGTIINIELTDDGGNYSPASLIVEVVGLL